MRINGGGLGLGGGGRACGRRGRGMWPEGAGPAAPAALGVAEHRVLQGEVIAEHGGRGGGGACALRGWGMGEGAGSVARGGGA